MRQLTVFQRFKWFLLTIFIFGGSAISVITGKELPPFSPYPMYSWPIDSDKIYIARVVPINSDDLELQKKILRINTPRTLSNLVGRAYANKTPYKDLAEGILKYYHAKLSDQKGTNNENLKLRFELVIYSHERLRKEIRQVSKAQTWSDMDNILSPSIRVIDEL